MRMPAALVARGEMILTFCHLENPQLFQVRRTRDRFVRSGQQFIHSPLTASFAVVEAEVVLQARWRSAPPLQRFWTIVFRAFFEAVLVRLLQFFSAEKLASGKR